MSYHLRNYIKTLTEMTVEELFQRNFLQLSKNVTTEFFSNLSMQALSKSNHDILLNLHKLKISQATLIVYSTNKR